MMPRAQRRLGPPRSRTATCQGVRPSPKGRRDVDRATPPDNDVRVLPTDGFVHAGPIGNRGLNLVPADPPPGRLRHPYGDGPFARLVMPPVPKSPGVYLWELNETVVYVGQTRMPLASRLGSNGYATISTYNTFARQPGRRNGGQQTNCRINALANAALAAGSVLNIWYRVTEPEQATVEEAGWMEVFGVPEWNRRVERLP